MDKNTIINQFKNIYSGKQFLLLLNTIKIDEYGENSYLFTAADIKKFTSPKNPDRYKVFTIPKKSGGTRQIASPTPTLKRMLHCTKIVLEAFYNPMPCVQGFTAGRSITKNAGMHLYQNYVYNIDLSDFFPSITQARVWKRLQLPPYNFPEKICRIIAGISCVTYKMEKEKNYNGLPQGAPTSPILSNIICEQMDRRLTGLAKRFGLHYSRYADDITFSSMHNVYKDDSEFLAELKKIITSQGFRFNEKKTRLQKTGGHQEVTGLTVSTKINVTRKYIQDLRSVLHVWEKFGYAEAYAWFYSRYKSDKGHSKKGEPVLEYVIDGKLNYLKMVKGDCDSTYKKLRLRYDDLVSVLQEQSPKRDTRHAIVSYTINEFKKRFADVSMEFTTAPNGYISGKLISGNVITPIYFDKIFRDSTPEEKFKIINSIHNGTANWYISEIEDIDKRNKHRFNHFWQITKYQYKVTTATIAENTVEKLLDIWEREGLDAAVRKWKNISQGNSEEPTKTS